MGKDFSFTAEADNEMRLPYSISVNTEDHDLFQYLIDIFAKAIDEYRRQHKEE